jgi:hypothetical protein
MMSLTLQIECPNCSATLQVQGESGQRLQVKCTQCFELLAFTVPSATPAATSSPSVPVQTSAVQTSAVRNSPVRNSPVRNAPVRPVSPPAQSAQKLTPTFTNETYFRPAPQPSAPMNPMIVFAVVAGIFGLCFVALTIGFLVWLLGTSREPMASLPPPLPPIVTPTDAYVERIGAAPELGPAYGSGFQPPTPLVPQGMPTIPSGFGESTIAVPVQSPERVIDEYFAIIAQAKNSMQDATVDARLRAMQKCNARSEALLRQAIALPYRPTELQRDFERRLEQWESNIPVRRIIANAQSLDAQADLQWLTLLDRYMRGPMFGLSIADDELPIMRYVQYVRALGNATNALASVDSVESAEAAAVPLQESYEYVAQFLIDRINQRVTEGTQIDHPVCEKVYEDLIVRFDGEISRRFSVGSNYRKAMDNLRFGISERNDSLLTDLKSLQKAIDERPKPVLASSNDTDADGKPNENTSMANGNVAKAEFQPTTSSGASSNATGPLAPLPDGFTSQNMSVDQRAARTKEFSSSNTKRIVIEGAVEFPEAAVIYARRLKVDDFFVDYRTYESVLMIRDGRSITSLAGEIDFGEVLNISLPDNEAEVRYQGAAETDSE